MATKKTTQTKALVNWEQEMAREAAIAADAAKNLAVGNFLSVKGAKFSLGGNDLGNELDVVILDYIRENTYYSEGFDSDSPQSPECYAFARTDEADTMAPHPEAADPQHEACKGCPNAEWGSAERGRGKACSERWRLALTTADQLEDVENAEVRYLRISPTNGKAFITYMRGLLAASKPLWTVVTKLTVQPDDKTMIALSFRAVDRAATDGASYGALKAKHDAVAQEIAFPYPKYEEREEPASRKPAKYSRAGRGRK